MHALWIISTGTTRVLKHVILYNYICIEIDELIFKRLKDDIKMWSLKMLEKRRKWDSEFKLTIVNKHLGKLNKKVCLVSSLFSKAIKMVFYFAFNINITKSI